MPDTPWLSILVPVYNPGRFLAPCLGSILAQCDGGVEVVLLDDASSDGSAAVLQQAAANHPAAVRLLRHARNQGENAARNHLLDAARGDYLWFVDADDLLADGAVAALAGIVRRERPDVVLCDYRVQLEPGADWRMRLRARGRTTVFRGPARSLQTDRSALLGGLLATSRMHAWSKVVRRALWQGLRYPATDSMAGVGLMPRLMVRAARWWYEPAPWVLYRRGHESMLQRLPRLRKSDDRLLALAGAAATLAAAGPWSADTHWRWSHYVAGHFVAACATAARSQQGLDDARLCAYRQVFDAETALPAAALLAACLRRGAWWRAARLQAWLRRADAAARREAARPPQRQRA
jgi:hypothetical protein